MFFSKQQNLIRTVSAAICNWWQTRCLEGMDNLTQFMHTARILVPPEILYLIFSLNSGLYAGDALSSKPFFFGKWPLEFLP